jgi:lysophospholipase L1-like esterase
MRAVQVPARLTNVAVGGRPAAECLRLYSADVAPLLIRPARFNLILFHAGDNDIAQGHDAVQTYAAFSRYVATAHAQGWKIIVSTELQRPDFPAGKQAALADYNRMLLANAAGADVVVDDASEPHLGNPAARSDPSVFSPDRVHPSDGGYAILARMLAVAAHRVLPR